MSSTTSPATPELLDYLAARTRSEDSFLSELRAAAAEAGIPAIAIAAEQASLMQILLRLAGSRAVLEVGTLFGYSAVAMARALPAGARVTTVEVEPRHAGFAREWIARSDVADRVEVLEGDGAEVLARLPDRSFDALFLDADKTSYGAYLEEGRRLLRPGALVMVDNAFAFGHLLAEEEQSDSVVAIRRFNDEFAAADDLDGIIVPLGDGLWVGVVQGDASR